MAGTGNKGGGGGKPSKPFLGDDLGSELDAWDATFDALPDEGPPVPAAPAEADATSQAAETFSWPAEATVAMPQQHAHAGDQGSLTVDESIVAHEPATADEPE